MEEMGCLPVLYLSAWLLTSFASAFPLVFAARIVDVLLTDSFAEPMMKVWLNLQRQIIMLYGVLFWAVGLGKSRCEALG